MKQQLKMVVLGRRIGNGWAQRMRVESRFWFSSNIQKGRERTTKASRRNERRVRHGRRKKITTTPNDFRAVQSSS
jgi:hypothetical protein